jgi:hypothetical protein
MQITFKTQKPKDLKGTLVYERTIKQTEVDDLDKIFIEFATEISSYLSDDYYKIELNLNIGLNDFHPESYNTKKSIKLTFICKDLSENNEKTINLDLFFDSADSNLINEKIKEFHKNQICKKAFELLDTLIIK